MGWARDLPRDHALKIIVHMPRTEAPLRAMSEIPDGIKRFFAYRADAVTRDLRELFRVGRTSFAIGISVLIVCVLAAQHGRTVFGDGPFATAVRESLIILGWVANWRPLEIFLYEWWPIARRRNVYRRLAAADVTVNLT